MSVFRFSDVAYVGVVGSVAAFDPDAQAYITAVETADGQALEAGVRTAINNFVVGCKADGIWNAIKASCILAGARTLNGALQPLVGTAPTNFNFVAGDYNRKTGLVGDVVSKYLNANRRTGDQGQDNVHLSAFLSTVPGNDGTVIGGGSAPGLHIAPAGGTFRARCNTLLLTTGTTLTANKLTGVSRNNSSSYTRLQNNAVSTVVGASEFFSSGVMAIFGRAAGQFLWPGRIAFYSIGESLDLALLDARVTALINAFGAAIP